jgi:hypothetical protein
MEENGSIKGVSVKVIVTGEKMGCNYVKDGECTYRRNKAKNKEVGGFCNGIPAYCPWQVLKDKKASP